MYIFLLVFHMFLSFDSDDDTHTDTHTYSYERATLLTSSKRASAMSEHPPCALMKQLPSVHPSVPIEKESHSSVHPAWPPVSSGVGGICAAEAREARVDGRWGVDGSVVNDAGSHTPEGCQRTMHWHNTQGPSDQPRTIRPARKIQDWTWSAMTSSQTVVIVNTPMETVDLT